MGELYIVRKSCLTCNHMGQVKFLPVGVNPAAMAAKVAQKVAELAVESVKKVTEEMAKDSDGPPNPAEVAIRALKLQKDLVQQMPAAFDGLADSPVVWHIENSAVVTKEDLLERAFIVGCINIGPGLKPCTKIIQVFPTVLSRLTVAEGVHPEETPVLDLLNQFAIAGSMTDSTVPGWLIVMPPKIGVNQTSGEEELMPDTGLG